MNNENQIQRQEMQLQELPNSTIVLILGILSIFFFCMFMGILSLVMGIIALVLAQQSNRLYQETPRMYTEASHKNLNAGKTCAIVGIALSSIIIIVVMLAIFLGLSLALSAIPFCL